MKICVIAGLTGVLLVGPAMAESQFDGSKPLLCAPSDAIQCASEGECGRGEAEHVNLPNFVEIDVAKKTISAVGGERTTAIHHVAHDADTLILHGVDAGRGWSATISGATGNLTLTAASDSKAFVVFGACTPR